MRVKETAMRAISGRRVTRVASQIPASSTNFQSIASSTTAVTLLEDNRERLGASIYNDSTAVLFLLLGVGTPSSTVYSVQLPADAYFEVPYNFTGKISGVWESVNGSAKVTEFI